MRTESLLRVLRAIESDATQIDFAASISQIETNYSTAITSPTSAAQAALDTSLDALDKATEHCAVDALKPSEFRLLARIGAQRCTGRALHDEIRDIVDGIRGGAPSVVPALQELRKRYAVVLESSRGILLSAKLLRIEPDPDPRAPEVGVFIPSGLVGNSIDDALSELKAWSRLLANLSELYSTNTISPALRSLDSGSLQLYVYVDGSAAAGIVAILLQLSTLLTQHLERKKLRLDIKEHYGAHLAKEAEKKDREDLERLVADVVKQSLAEARPTKARANELTNHLAKQIRFLADRIAQGADVEVNEPHSPAETDATVNGPELPGPTQSQLDTIRQHGRVLATLPPRQPGQESLPGLEPLDEELVEELQKTLPSTRKKG